MHNHKKKNGGYDLSLSTPEKIDKNDLLLEISKKFFNGPQTTYQKIYNVLYAFAKDMMSYSLDHKSFIKHPLTKNENLIEVWDKKRALFSKIKEIYLMMETAIRLLV